jgi:hypothetical protein
LTEWIAGRRLAPAVTQQFGSRRGIVCRQEDSMAKKAAIKAKRKARATNGNGFGPSCAQKKTTTKKKKAGKKR